MSDPIYDIDFSTEVNNLLPVQKRTPTFKGWLTALLTPLQWLRDNFFTYYTDGGPDNLWVNVTAYVPGDIVVDDIDNGVYECFRNNTGMQPSTANDPAYWIKICDDFRGVYERVKYTGQKITLEWILNRWYRLNFAQPDSVANPQTTLSDIYIVNNILNNSAFIIANSDTLGSVIGNKDPLTFIKNTYDFTDNAFTIFVPESGGSPSPGWYTALGPYAEQKIRSVADKYIIAGIAYDIQTY